ncbi:hypothetical protein EMN47_06410 [Prolixibacteraceae bacterium JC049]|nr:hypothetical protein [Prolixibacteraceae bacterium JC049]
MRTLTTLLLIISFLSAVSQKHVCSRIRPFNDYYCCDDLNKIAFPMGGIGAGMICMQGTGAISHISINNQPDIFNEPYAYAALMVKGVENGAKVLQTQVPYRKVFGMPNTGRGATEHTYGLPRFEGGEFLPRFPFATLKLEDKHIPLNVEVTGWSPFIPGDEDNSSLPVAIMEYTFQNNSDQKHEAIFSWNSKYFLKGNGTRSIEKATNGFTMVRKNDDAKSYHNSWLTASVDDDNAVVDYCWFRGGWFDANTIAWKKITEGDLTANAPVKKDAPGASIYVPFTLKPGEKKTVRLQLTWYVPHSNISYGQSSEKEKMALNKTAAPGTAANQQTITGFVGKQLINTFYPSGDAHTGTIESPSFIANKRYLKFLVGGGNDKQNTCVVLKHNDKIIYRASGKNTEQLKSVIWDLKAYKGQTLKVQIIDNSTSGWGHILADQFILTNNKNENLEQPSANATILNSFEKEGALAWEVETEKDAKCCPESGCKSKEVFYQPWYASRFKNIEDVNKYMRLHYSDLKQKSQLFTDAFYSSTLPPEVIEAVAANLTILKSPTVLRQYDGRMWAWEGCNDLGGCCAGSCTHVWNYAQAIPHLFPALERTLRETEFKQSQNTKGHQTFRSGLPIKPVTHNFYAAADGQLGGIMKIYRDWRISGDTQWIQEIYPKVKSSLDYCIQTWDPKHKGILEEPHHNTYDIEFWGPDGMCTSFYLGALTAFVEISKELDKPYKEYEKLLRKGKKFMEKELFDGEYFIQKIQWEGLKAANPVEFSKHSWTANYSKEAKELLKKEGPKYQYGKGCLSDGILGMWMANVSGLPEIIDNEKVTSHLNSIFKYNLKEDLRNHANPQRPSYACGEEGGVLLCTWPKGGELSLPFVYSNEVWTGIEYQVASHLMLKGEVNKGLKIVQEVRRRYDGKKRNPFNEYECGHWYARAMASYGLLQGLTGVRYDAVTQTLYIDSKIGNNFTTFLSTEKGFGNVGLKDGKPFCDVKYGQITVKEFKVK